MAKNHEGLRELSRDTLTGQGYHVVMAPDGEQAVSEIIPHKDLINLLLFDMVLPRLGGPEAHACISAISPHIPVPFVTSYSSDTALRNSVQQHGLPVLQSPIPREIWLAVSVDPRQTLPSRFHKLTLINPLDCLLTCAVACDIWKTTREVPAVRPGC